MLSRISRLHSTILVVRQALDPTLNHLRLGEEAHNTRTALGTSNSKAFANKEDRLWPMLRTSEAGGL